MKFTTFKIWQGSFDRLRQFVYRLKAGGKKTSIAAEMDAAITAHVKRGNK